MSGAQKIFSKSRSRRCGRFRQIFVEIGAILAIIRPFENFDSVEQLVFRAGMASASASASHLGVYIRGADAHLPTNIKW